ncbi:MAG: gluconokinase [Opitutales bacterium]
MIIIIMGVCGSGKSTIGQMLARELAIDFWEGDEFHPAVNREKMSRGDSLTEEDRRPWLEKIRETIDQYLAREAGMIVSCSALTRKSRQILGTDRQEVKLVYLSGSESILTDRMRGRENHFMPVSLLRSQLETLEEPGPGDALIISVDADPDDLIREILSGLQKMETGE